MSALSQEPRRCQDVRLEDSSGDNASISNESKVKISFRDWYMSNYCTEAHVLEIETLQRNRFLGNAIIRHYFRIWSLFADLEFFVCSIPPLFWGGWPEEAMRIVSMLFLGQYICSVLKDYGNCQRPPCPPLQVLGNPATHKTEYGFPSSHAAHSGIFAYFFYTTIVKNVFPGASWLALLISLVYLLHIGFSRLYLAMHWRMDIVGGWVIAIVVTALHAAWIDRLENRILNTSGSAVGYIVLIIVGFGFSTLHPTPKDKCPCYVDSMRFTGVLMGMFLSCWWIYSVNGTLQTRERADLFQDTMLSWHFVLQLMTGIVMAVLVKLATDLLAKPVVKHFYLFLAGCYADKLPECCYRHYLRVSRWIGFAFGNRVAVQRSTPSNPWTLSANIAPQVMQDPGPGMSFRGNAEPVVSPKSSVQELNCSDRAEGGGGRVVQVIICSHQDLEDGYLFPSQQWSLRTHGHWWAWEVHCKALSYMMLTISCVFFYPLILRFCWGVQVPQSTIN